MIEKEKNKKNSENKPYCMAGNIDEK